MDIPVVDAPFADFFEVDRRRHREARHEEAGHRWRNDRSRRCSTIGAAIFGMQNGVANDEWRSAVFPTCMAVRLVRFESSQPGVVEAFSAPMTVFWMLAVTLRASTQCVDGCRGVPDPRHFFSSAENGRDALEVPEAVSNLGNAVGLCGSAPRSSAVVWRRSASVAA